MCNKMDKWYIKNPPPPEIKKIREENKLIDVHLVLNDRTIKAHKFILAAYCNLFNSLFSVQSQERKLEKIDINPPDPDIFESFINVLYHQKPLKNLQKYKEWYLKLKILETLDYLQMDINYEEIIHDIMVYPEDFHNYASLVLKILDLHTSTFNILLSNIVYGADLSILKPYKNEILGMIKPAIIFYHNDTLISVDIDNKNIYNVILDLDEYDNIIYLSSDRVGKFYIYITEYDKNVNILYANGLLYKKLNSENVTSATISGNYVATPNALYDINNIIIYNFEKPSIMFVFSYDNRYLCYVEQFNTFSKLNILDIYNKKILKQLSYKNIYDMDISKDDILIFSTNDNIIFLNIHTLTFWTLNFNNVKSLSISPIFKYLLFIHENNLTLYNYESKKIIKQINTDAEKVRWSENIKYILLISESKSDIFNIDDEELLFNVRTNIVTWIPKNGIINEIIKL